MVKTALMKLKDEEGKEYVGVFGDLTELYEELDNILGNAEKITDLADGLFGFRRSLAKIISDCISQHKEKEVEKKAEQQPIQEEG